MTQAGLLFWFRRLLTKRGEGEREREREEGKSLFPNHRGEKQQRAFIPQSFPRHPRVATTRRRAHFYIFAMDFRLPSCLGGGESSKPRVTLSVGRMAGRLVWQNVFRKKQDKNYRVAGRGRRGEGESTLSASQRSHTQSLRQVISRKELLQGTNANLDFSTQGRLRFLRPSPADPWPGLLDASQKCPTPMQLSRSQR